jgi:DNA recombination protein RmuC
LETALFIIVLILLVFVLIAIFLLYQKFSRMSEQTKPDQSLQVMGRWMEQMQARLDRNADVLERGLRETNVQVSQRLDKTGEMLGVVGQRIGEMSEIGRSMQDLGDLLKSPKLRGNIGEYILKDLLKQYLPPTSFSLQHTFKNGSIADAIIKTEHGLICIDSKFPLENFKKLYAADNELDKERFRRDFIRDVRKHIEAISTKYVLPEEQTVDYAIMYIPSESIYYEVICQEQELAEYAQSKQVVIVSPSMFYAYLQVILLSFEGKKVEDQARELMRNFRGLEQEFKKFGEQFSLGYKHLSNARNAFDDAQSKYQSVEGKLQRVLHLEENLTLKIQEPQQTIN